MAEDVVKKDWFFQDDNEKALGIETVEYENGGKCKRCSLSDGRVAIARRLKGKDQVFVERLTNNNAADMKKAVIAISTKIDDKDILMESLDDMWYSDFTKVQVMSLALNFL